MRFGKGGTPVGSYVLVGLRMQLGAHASAGTGGGGLKGQKIVFWRSERERTKKKFRGWGKQRPKEVLLDVLSMGGID